MAVVPSVMVMVFAVSVSAVKYRVMVAPAAAETVVKLKAPLTSVSSKPVPPSPVPAKVPFTRNPTVLSEPKAVVSSVWYTVPETAIPAEAMVAWA